MEFFKATSCRALLICLLLVAGPRGSVIAEDNETGSIKGRVFNEITQRYLKQVDIRIEGTSIRALTNAFGEYHIRNVPAGQQTIIANYTGMESERQSVWVTAGEDLTQDFSFRNRRGSGETVYELEEFVVEASTFESMQELAVHEERHSVNLKNIVSTDSYGLVAQGNVGEFVKFLPGVTIGYGGSNSAGGTYSSGADANTISIRGYSARETNITIDGMAIANAAPGTLDPAIGLDMLSINNASRVEVIKVPSPDQPNAGVGGTVNLVSMSAFEYPKPTLNFRIYFGLNSEHLDVFNKTPGPMNRPTYKALPGFELTYAYPLSDNLGLSLSLSSANQSNANYNLKSRIRRFPEADRPTNRTATSGFKLKGEDFSYWLTEDPHFSDWQQQYGDDWTQWTEDQFFEMYSSTGASEALVRSRLDDVKRLPKYDQEGRLVGAWSPDDKAAFEDNFPYYYDEDGNRVGQVYNDWGHPFVNRIQVTDSPRIQHRNSAALKADWRPFDGFVVSTNYQLSTFKDQDANRRVHEIAGDPFEYGPDYLLSYDGGVRLDTDAFTREGITHSGFIKAAYYKGPWEIDAHISYSTSESDLKSAENGHFSVIEVGMGGVDYTEFLDIDKNGVPQVINYYRNITNEAGEVTGRELIDIGDLSNYNISNFDPDDPGAGTLKVRSGGIHATSDVSTAKFDIRRDLDFIPGQFMNLAVKGGIYWEEREGGKTGRGINYEYVYLGEEGHVLSLSDFRDNRYTNVDPGFGLKPLEWPDPFKLYRYASENPSAFSDTDDRVPAGTNSQSVAAHNYIEEVNTSKSITETKWAYYGQLEGDFFNNRLSVVGGFRMGQSERKGYDRGQDAYWNYLHFDKDNNGDNILDVFKDYDGIAIDPSYNADTLGTFDVTGPSILLNALRMERVTSYDQLSAQAQQEIMTWYGYYEQAGAVYADGSPFIASEFEPLVRGSLRSVQYQFIRDFAIKQRAQGRPQPIISAAYDITDRLVLRLSWSTTYSNPPYESSEGAGGTLRRVQFIEDPDGSGSMSITNPELEISKTIGWDGGLSYYTDSGGKYSITLYHRTEYDRPIDVFYSRSGSEEAWQRLMKELGYGAGSYFYDNNWSVNTSINANGTFIDYGYELEARQDLSQLGEWGKHVYLYGSFFQQFQKAGSVPEDEEGDFNVSRGNERRLNASGGINLTYKRIEFRVNAVWRNERTVDGNDAFIDAIFWEDATVGNPGWYTADPDDDDPDSFKRTMQLIRPEDIRVDLSGSIRLTKHLAFTFSARNITKSNPEPIYVLKGEGKLPLIGHLHDGTEKAIYGIDFTLGISGSF